MYPTYPVYFFLAYLLLFLAIPVVFALGGTWRRAQAPRPVTCPGCGTTEKLTLDRWYAVRRRAAGEDDEVRIAGCTAWPGRHACRQECLTQIAAIL
jgi:hypothetical protein